jgi:hypothetical protein
LVFFMKPVLFMEDSLLCTEEKGEKVKKRTGLEGLTYGRTTARISNAGCSGIDIVPGSGLPTRLILP